MPLILRLKWALGSWFALAISHRQQPKQPALFNPHAHWTLKYPGEWVSRNLTFLIVLERLGGICLHVWDVWRTHRADGAGGDEKVTKMACWSSLLPRLLWYEYSNFHNKTLKGHTKGLFRSEGTPGILNITITYMCGTATSTVAG